MSAAFCFSVLSFLPIYSGAVFEGVTYRYYQAECVDMSYAIEERKWLVAALKHIRYHLDAELGEPPPVPQKPEREERPCQFPNLQGTWGSYRLEVRSVDPAHSKIRIQGPYHSSISQCDNCRGEGKV